MKWRNARRNARSGVLGVATLAATLAWSRHLQAETFAPHVSEAPTPTRAELPAVCRGVAAFYYPWYGSPARNGGYRHWPQGDHEPPDAIGSDYWPALGPYSSTDPAVLDQHMRWAREAGIGVLITSWWGPGSFEDRATPELFAAAARHGIEIAFHFEPYEGSHPERLVADARSLLARFGDHPALHRGPAFNGRPPIFVFRSLQHEPAQWRRAIDRLAGELPALQRPAWIAQTTDLKHVIAGGFDGGYPYDILPWFRDTDRWRTELSETVERFAAQGKVFVPSIGPGYLDDRAVPEGVDEPESARTRDDGTGETYRLAWRAVAGWASPMVTITSFNEWHEGSQIEPAVFRRSAEAGVYHGYGGDSSIYLHRTRRGVEVYTEALRPAAESQP